jgi:hypothetical protein
MGKRKSNKMFVIFIDFIDLLDQVGKFFLVIYQILPELVLCGGDDLGHGYRFVEM